MSGDSDEQLDSDHGEKPSPKETASMAEPIVPPIDELPTIISQRGQESELKLPPLSQEIGPNIVGITLEHFRLDEFVGGGGMGVVFRAHDLSLDRTVAVKVLSGHQTEDSLRRFRNEAQSAARLDHPNIARVYYVGEDQGWNYIVFEYIDGVNVRDVVINKGPLSLEEVLSYSVQIASAIDHAWQRNVIHRDIKPSNILVMDDGQAKLVDMGLARFHQIGAPSEDLTASGTTLGTFDYISPEQARDPREADVRSDLYSLGCTMYFMLTGQPPFPHGTVLQKLLSHSGDPPPDPRLLRPDIPDQLLQTLYRLLAKQPNRRFESPEELIHSFLRLGEELGLAFSEPAGGQRFRETPRGPTWWQNHLPWAASVVALVMLAAASELFFVSPKDQFFPEPQTATAGYRSSETITKDAQPPEANGASDSNGSVEPASPGDSTSVDQTGQGDPSESSELGSTTNHGRTEPPVQNADAVVAEEGMPVKVVQVSPAPIVQPGIASVRTFEQALAYAVKHSSVSEIVLAWDGLRKLEPQLRSWGDLHDRDLLIRAAKGHEVGLEIAPSFIETQLGTRPAMISLGPNRWTFEGIHWLLTMDPQLQERQGWSMFSVSGDSEITMRRCSISIANVDEQGYRVHPHVAVFRAMAAPSSEETMVRGKSQGPQIWLEQCFIRGETQLLAVDTVESVLLSWQHGILVSSERVVEVTGMPEMESVDPSRLECMFDEVIFLSDQGVLLSRQTDMRSALPDIAVNLRRSIIVTNATEPNIAVYEQRGITEGSWRPPQISGSSNRYANTDVLLRTSSRTVSQATAEFSLEQIAKEPPPWFIEELSQPLTRSPWSRLSVPASRMQKADLISEVDQQRALEMAQFDLEAIARIPEPPTPAAADDEIDES